MTHQWSGSFRPMRTIYIAALCGLAWYFCDGFAAALVFLAASDLEFEKGGN